MTLVVLCYGTVQFDIDKVAWRFIARKEFLRALKALNWILADGLIEFMNRESLICGKFLSLTNPK